MRSKGVGSGGGGPTWSSSLRVYPFASTIWSPPQLFTGGGWEVGHDAWLRTTYGLGATTGIAAVLVALSWPRLARGMVVVAGLMLLSGLCALRTITPLLLLSLGLTGVALLGSAPFMVGCRRRRRNENNADRLFPPECTTMAANGAARFYSKKLGVARLDKGGSDGS